MDLCQWLPESWSDWAAVFQLLELVVVVIALIYAKSQLDEAAKARTLEATKEILDQFGNEDIRLLRWWVTTQMPPFEALTEEQLWDARRVAVCLDRIGFMVKHGMAPQESLFEWLHPEFQELWEKLEPVIQYMRTKHNRVNYCPDFEYLVREWIPMMEARQR